MFSFIGMTQSNNSSIVSSSSEIAIKLGEAPWTSEYFITQGSLVRFVKWQNTERWGLHTGTCESVLRSYFELKQMRDECNPREKFILASIY